MAKRAVEIDETLCQRSEAKADQEGTTLSAVIESYLTSWLGPEPAPEEMVTRIREEIYVVRRGDTLARIALAQYGDTKQYPVIAQYNNIADPRIIRVGQHLKLPFNEVILVSREEAGKRFRFPLDVTETPYYKFGDLYSRGSRWAGKPHPGVDLHQAKGANVYAAGEGTMLVNRFDATGYGHYLVIGHTLASGRAVYSLYGHLQLDDDSFTTPPVDTKVRGTDMVIGKEGETGYAGVPHVHFEIKKTDELGLYSGLNTYNLYDCFYDPYTFIDNPYNLCMPVE